MCYGCYKEYGEPKIVSDETHQAAKLIGQVYESSTVGGNLHIVVDDWNLEDEHLDFCAGAIEKNYHEIPPECQETERMCLSALRKLNLEGRASALAIHDGYLSNA